ncbi:MAG: phosphotransferase [Clostridia bacterium]|nr:phosphotransferase [Clostridia bacterium]
MFTVTKEQVASILRDFGMASEVAEFTELQRSHYEKDDPETKEVRLITKVGLANGKPLVVRFKNEEDVTLEIINAQSRFARLLAEHGVETPTVYAANGQYARWYALNGYDVIVTVEDFVPGEVRAVDAAIAEKTGGLLARMHNIAENADFHVQNDVLFDPLKANDLFSFEDFEAQKDVLSSLDKALYDDITRRHEELLQRVRVFENEPRYAVQGDISDCNLYQTDDGTIGVFDFNRCGDNVLYYDAIMQAIFEARLMVYAEELAGKQEEIILSAFLKGYHRERPFTRQQIEVFPCLYAIVSTFWRMDVNRLINSIKTGKSDAAHEWMEKIQKRLTNHKRMPL